jgi:hypothetical protein
MTVYTPFVSAIQFNGVNIDDVQTFLEAMYATVVIDDQLAPDSVLINTFDAESNPIVGDVTLNNGSWVVRSGLDGLSLLSDESFQAQFMELPS